jgi:hypothetical protein
MRVIDAARSDAFCCPAFGDRGTRAASNRRRTGGVGYVVFPPGGGPGDIFPYGEK